MNRTRKPLAKVLVLSALSTSALAQTDPATDSPETLDTVSVTTGRVERPVNAIPGTTTVVDRAHIEQQSTIADDLASVLENTVPGFGPSLRKLTGRAESFRGRNPLYMIDGVPQHNALRDGSRDGHTIDIDFIERIEVIHGANAIQGIGATGGIVGMVTRTAENTGRWQNSLKASLTTDDGFESDGLGYKLSWLGGIATDDYDLTTGIAWHQRGMLYDGDDNLVGLYPTQGDTMDSTSRDLFLKAGYNLPRGQRIQLMINDFELERDADFRSVDGDPDIGVPTSSEKGAPIDVGDPAMNDVTTITLDYHNTQWLGGSFIAQLYHQDYAALFEGGFFGNFFRLTPDGEPFLDQSQVESEKLGLKLTQSWPDVGGITGLSPTIGLDFQQDQTAQVLTQSGREWVPETTLSSIAPFVQLDYDITEQLRVTGGLRHESAELKVDDYVTIAAANSTAVDGGNPDYTDTLKNLGLAFDISEQITVYGAFSDGFTMPDVGRVLRGVNTPGQDVDTLIDLEPVVTENQELGIDMDIGNARLHIAWYRSNTDLGSRLERDENDIFHVRREKTEIEGWEIAGDIDITDTAKAGFNYTKIKGRIDSDDDGKLDTDLDGLNIAPDRLNLFGEMLLTSNVLGRLQIAHLFDRDFDNADPEDPGFTFDGFTTADLFLSAGSRFGDISLGIENLLDKQYVTYFSQAQANQRANAYFAGPGRTLTLGWQIDF